MGTRPKHRTEDSVPTRDPLRTSRRILDRAVERFDRDGPSGVVVTAIAREAGVSVGAVYHHFSGRSGLIAAARAEQFRRTTQHDLEQIVDLIDRAESFEEFQTFNRALIRRNRDDDRITARRQRLAALSAAADDDETALELREVQRSLDDGLVAAIGRARARGWFSDDVDPQAWAVLVQGVFLGAVLMDLDDRVDGEAWMELMERVQALAIREAPAGTDGRDRAS